jgi:hypothetical protein
MITDFCPRGRTRPVSRGLGAALGLAVLGAALATAADAAKIMTVGPIETGGTPPPAVRLEIRLASTTPVEGWIAATEPATDQDLYLSPEVALSNADVARAWPDVSGGEPCVGLLLTPEGTQKLAILTRNHKGERLAFVIDNGVVTAPCIAAEIRGGRALIHGNFSVEAARAVAAGITAGAQDGQGQPPPVQR